MRIWKKRAIGGDPLTMISTILMIITLVIGLSGQCKEKKKEQPIINQGIINLPGPTLQTKTCQELNGYSCDPFKQSCVGERLPASDNSKNSICYSDRPRQMQQTDEELQTCAFMKGEDCGFDRYCPNNQWVSSKDTQTCCKVGCVKRIQTTAYFDNLGETVIERFDNNIFGVWYGSSPQTRAFDANMGFVAIGHPNFAKANNMGNNKYEFHIENNKHSFRLVKNEVAEIGVVVG